jgi:putative ubiquitin-RnfH superfamily antitoxin RatB of RatAB toxin-antitoxin module
VEVLRPLPEDPKERRRRLAREGRTMSARLRNL